VVSSDAPTMLLRFYGEDTSAAPRLRLYPYPPGVSSADLTEREFDL
jgi:hypothetical protein